MLAALNVEEVWQPDREAEAMAAFGRDNREHPGVAHVLDKAHPFYVGGRLDGLQHPSHYDFRSLRLTPEELRAAFSKLGWRRVVAFQTRNPMHRAHYELTLRAAKEAETNLLIHPVVGMTKPGDLDHYTRVRCYQALLSHYPRNTVKLALLPLAMRMAGPREAIWHAIIRKNYGCTHLIVGRDHAGPGSDSKGKPFYGPYDAQELLQKHEEELGVTMVPFKMVVYVEEQGTHIPMDEVSEGTRTLNLSGTELRERLARGQEIPSWFTFPEVAEELQRTHPPRHRQGFTVFFHGTLGLRQVDDRQCPPGQIARAGRASGHSVGRRYRSQEPFLRARFLEGASRHQYPAHWFRGFGDLPKRRDRHLRPDCAV